MTRRAAAADRDRSPVRRRTLSAANLLNRLAASPWALACASFVATALLIHSGSLPIV